MINKYYEFIVEKLILESAVVYSDRFKKVLTRIPNNEIAQKLLEIENQDLEIAFNFFDTKIDSDQVITFTNDRTAQEIINPVNEKVRYIGRRGGWLRNTGNAAIFRALDYAPASEEVYYPNREEIGEILSKYVSKQSGKTWCYVKFPGGKGVYDITKLNPVNQEELKKQVFQTRRQDVRIGRLVRVILQANHLNFPDAQIETFVNEFRSILSILNDVFSRFEIVEGEQLGFWYHRRNYQFPHQGSLGSSCQAVGNLNWLEIYIDNPDTVKLLILKSEDTDEKIVGRALLWYLDDGNVMMDQIYVSKQSDENVFKEYARSKNWKIKNYNDTYVAHMKVKPEGYAQYPSVDTMNLWDPRTGKISNKNFDGCRRIVWSQDGDDEDWEEDDDF